VAGDGLEPFLSASLCVAFRPFLARGSGPAARSRFTIIAIVMPVLFAAGAIHYGVAGRVSSSIRPSTFRNRSPARDRALVQAVGRVSGMQSPCSSIRRCVSFAGLPILNASYLLRPRYRNGDSSPAVVLLNFLLCTPFW